MGPSAVPDPMPELTNCRGSRSSRLPNAYDARRLIAFPATTFSPIAYLSNDAIVPGAMIGTFPEATSASSTTPLTPP